MRLPDRLPAAMRHATKSALLRAVVLACASCTAFAYAESAVLTAMQTELARSMEVLGQEEVPPYFLSYEITEQESVSVSAQFGALVHSDQRLGRYLDVDLRVGDHKLDNTRQLRGAQSSFRSGIVMMPIEDDVDAIREGIWNATNRRYRRSVERLAKVQSDVEIKVDAEDQSDDFSREEPKRQIGEATSLSVDVADWERKARSYSEPFAAYGDIYAAAATLSAVKETRWFVSSEGAELRTSEVRFRLYIWAQTKAEDGMKLPRFESFTAFSVDGLPSDEAVLETVAGMIEDLAALRRAPLVDPYTGPAILSGRASGVFFHEILGHRVEGHRQKHADAGQTFKKKINERVLPAGFSVRFDPTRRRIGEIDLVGAYDFDNEGVAGRPVTVIEDGIFKGFLMSRTPIEGHPVSNGHGRKEAGYRPVARQSNLFVDVAAPVSPQALEAQLLAMVEEQGKPFGLLFEDIQGGVTYTGRSMPNAFNVDPIMVYRIFPDGRRELVRGVDLIGTPLTTLSRVVAADSEVAVFNGLCGAESGRVPVAAVSPGILVAQIEVQKKQKSQVRTPLLPPPFAASMLVDIDLKAGH